MKQKIFAVSVFVWRAAAPNLHWPLLGFYRFYPAAFRAPGPSASVRHSHRPSPPRDFPFHRLPSLPFFLCSAALPTEKEGKLHRSCILLLFQRDTSAPGLMHSSPPSAKISLVHLTTMNHLPSSFRSFLSARKLIIILTRTGRKKERRE